MKRIEKAYEYYPDGVVYIVANKQVMITNCCPYFVDVGDDEIDEQSMVGERGNVKGCRGITCEQCWGKEYVVD